MAVPEAKDDNPLVEVEQGVDLHGPEILRLRVEFAKRVDETVQWSLREPVNVGDYFYYLGNRAVNRGHRICTAAEEPDELVFLGEALTQTLGEKLQEGLAREAEAKGKTQAFAYAVFTNMTRRQRGEQDKLFSVVRPD